MMTNNKPKVLITSAAFGFHFPDKIVRQESDRVDVTINRICDNVSTVTTSDAPEPKTTSQAPRTKAMHPRLRAKMPKMLQWAEMPGYDYYIWLDASLSITNPKAAELFVDACRDFDACFFMHRGRSSIKQEVDFVVDNMPNDTYLSQRYEGEDMINQVDSYLSDPTFKDDRLFECGNFVYSKNLVHNADHNLLKEWFYHNCIWSVEDQLSLPYLIHKFGTKVGTLSGTQYHNHYCLI